jgi:type II secretory pathway pseudopilin PulG
MTQTPPGWYLDPMNLSSQRYWDGQQWTEHSAPAPGSRAANEDRRHKNRTALIALLSIALVVVSIVALFAALVVPRVQTQRKYQTVAVVVDLSHAAINIQVFHALYHSYPTSLNALAGAQGTPPFQIARGHIIEMSTDGVTGFCLTATSLYSDYDKLAKVYDSRAGGFQYKGIPCSVSYPYRYFLPADASGPSSAPVVARFDR